MEGNTMKRILVVIMAALLLSSAYTAHAYENVTPTEAYYMATTEADTYILDVRTRAEWDWVGHPGENRTGEGAALPGKVINIAYMIEYKGDLIVNPSLLIDVKNAFPNPAEVTLITMCRSGGRSIAAAEALEAAGYPFVKNMVTGFEGGKDGSGYRTVNGWKVDGLPYNYSGEGYHTAHHGRGNAYGLHD